MSIWWLLLTAETISTSIPPISYPDKVRERDLGIVNTIGRGTLLLRASDEADSQSINEYLRNMERLQKMTLPQKQKMVRWIVRSAIGKNTFEVSYTGRVRTQKRSVTQFKLLDCVTMIYGIFTENRLIPPENL